MAGRTKSSESIGFPESESQVQVIKSHPLPYGKYLYDTSVFVIKCVHKKIPLFRINENKSLWLPYVRSNPGQVWVNSREQLEQIFINEQTIDFEKRVLVKNGFIDQSMQMMNFLRIQLPTEEFVERHLFLSKWKSTPEIVCCKDTDHIEWIPIADVINGKLKARLWGPEVSEFATLINKTDPQLRRSSIEFKEILNRDVYRFLSYDTKSEKREEKLVAESLTATALNRRVMEKLYSDFLQHCYPSVYMSFISYKQYMTRIQFKTTDDLFIERSFVAINYEKTGFLSFDEFLSGIIALETNSPQNDLRIPYIFRFYDRNSDGVLDKSDIKEMVTNMRSLKGLSLDTNDIKQMVNRIINLPDIYDKEERITLKTFLSKSDCEEFKSLSLLFRSPDPLHKWITTQNLYEPIGQSSKVLSKETEVKACPKHRAQDINYATHSVYITLDGKITVPKDVRNTDSTDIKFEDESDLVKNLRRHSIDVTNKTDSIPNFVIEVIRELGKILDKNDVSAQSKKDFKISTTEKLKISLIEHICDEMRQTFMAERRVIKVQTPIFILGDIHGNIRDLITFEGMLWKTGPQCMPSSILFAGDYVDRGDFGLECVLYLYSLKIMNPTKVFLLRGNHEIRSVQKNFTFEKECIQKYKIDGPKVFEVINQTFDVMPFAAVVDETVFVAHGGIPYSLQTISQLMNVPAILKDPKTECPAVWEILWSDPLNQEDFDKIIKFQNVKEDNGFINNTKRSTAYYFSEKAINEFLKRNQFSYMIRAHEVVENGYKPFFGAKVISIFSSSRYSGLKNKAACVHLDGYEGEGVIKIIVLETY